jgi:uncharacterized protein YraI
MFSAPSHKEQTVKRIALTLVAALVLSLAFASLAAAKTAPVRTRAGHVAKAPVARVLTHHHRAAV